VLARQVKLDKQINGIIGTLKLPGVSVDGPKSFIALLLLTAVIWGSSVAENANEATQSESFLAALEATWRGRAEVTPIGPRPYDITFERKKDGRVEGSTGASTVHYWTFYRQKNALVIRFLSTFGGNRDPIFLYAGLWGESGVLFKAKGPELLSVRVSFPSNLLSINVYHWDKPHVSIRLTRTY